MNPITISNRLAKSVDALTFTSKITHIYNPLQYARKPTHLYLKKYATPPKKVLFLGMNPGPFGMAQTGVPFGEVNLVRDWLKISAPVDKPPVEHPKRPILGFDSTRSEVSGARLWGWAKDRFKTPEAFFKNYFVWNYCPLVFMTETGANFTPDKLSASERQLLFQHCDVALNKMVDHLKPEWIIGVGKFAEDRAHEALSEHSVKIGRILHPSPASPAANRGWAEAVERQLDSLGISYKPD
jgi:single-strand selective monofunctional uracil DNA glycosylase